MSANETQGILVSMATYNERENLQPLIKEIHEYLPDADILVIDDNSPDGTGALADELVAADSRIHVIHREGKLGLGTASLAAMNYAIDHDYEFLLNVDADYSHHPRYLPAIVAGMPDHDVMIGSRYVPGGGTENWPLSRRLMSKAVNTFVRFTMRLPVKDTSGAYRCYRTSLLRRANLDKMISFGYSFQQEVLYRCARAGARIGETPIIFEDRKYGASKANIKEMIRSSSMLFYLGSRAVFGRL